jgi:hypothetical protein
MNFQKVTAISKKPAKVIHAENFHNPDDGLSLIKNLRETARIIFNIKNLGSQITVQP